MSWFCSAELLSLDTISDVIWSQSLLEWMLLFSRTSVAYRWTTFLSNNLATLFIRNRACLLSEKLPLSFRLGEDQLSWLVILLIELPKVSYWVLLKHMSSFQSFLWSNLLPRYFRQSLTSDLLRSSEQSSLNVDFVFDASEQKLLDSDVLISTFS